MLVLNGSFIALMGLMDLLVETHPTGEVMFTWVIILRALQGVTSGLINIIVQGEILDRYLTARKMFTVMISSSLFFGAIVTSILAAELYVIGGWSLACPIVGLTNIAPLLLLPAISSAGIGIRGEGHTENEENERLLKGEQSKDERDEDWGPVEEKVDENVKRTAEEVKECNMSRLRTIALYFPDLTTFVNNFMYNLLMFSLPARMVKFTDKNISSVILVTNLINVFSAIFALIESYLVEKALDIFIIMISGNFIFYLGCLITFGSTTTFLRFPLEFELGSLLMGMGDPCILNLVLVSKFVMYERWAMSNAGLGVRMAKVNNLVLNISCLLGMIASSGSVSRHSEIPVLSITAAAYTVGSLGLVAARLVK